MHASCGLGYRSSGFTYR